ncbi:MAG: VOC family protein [Brevundimonas sp.]|uniref:VOC family protein n=1 Tax=Brevundimonas sp. TaxID=1871086 RepID=UPI00391AF40F
MTPTLTPILHVPDVPASLAWYEALGFEVLDVDPHDAAAQWAHLAYGAGRVMLRTSQGPAASTPASADLYIRIPAVDALHAALPATVEVICGPKDKAYGMRELTVRDPNGFAVTFGETLDRPFECR